MYAVGVAAVTPGVLKQLEAMTILKRYGLLGELGRIGGVGILSALFMYVCSLFILFCLRLTADADAL